jgi:hypothetical protein
MSKTVTLSQEAEKELRNLAHSTALKSDMAAVADSRHNPFVQNGLVDVDAYIAFVCAYNEFINHEPKPFRRIIDKDMRL